jgi:NAD(P)-dependent dehydrogenase (short-subunit alcohol dehydrogenase family)
LAYRRTHTRCQLRWVGAVIDLTQRLVGRRIFITGGGSGIGRSAAIRVAAEGARVAVTDVRVGDAREVADEIVGSGGDAIAIGVDVASEPDVQEGVASAVEAFGGLDGVLANAGTAGAGWIHELELADWEAVLRINLTGVFLTTKHTIPHLLNSEGGSIVTTVSVAAHVVAMGGSAASTGHQRTVCSSSPNRSPWTTARKAFALTAFVQAQFVPG